MLSTPMLAVHGGAGRFPELLHDVARAGCKAALDAGLAVLDSGGSALDAVIASVRVLEDDPTFNAGVGSVLTRDGTVEADAAVMEGTGLGFGGVAAMPCVRQPIDIARAVLDDGEHVLLCAEGAWKFARERGFSPCDPGELITERARYRLDMEAERRRALAAGTIESSESALRSAPLPSDSLKGTVGACARDGHGRVAAATSTGGITYKRSGRIGDTPLCGCGTYADDRGGAASATGDGEAIIRVTMTRLCVELMRSGVHAHEAAWRAVDALGADVKGQGGIICVDNKGRLGIAHNTPTMAMGAAYASNGGSVQFTSVSIDRSLILFKRSSDYPDEE